MPAQLNEIQTAQDEPTTVPSLVLERIRLSGLTLGARERRALLAAAERRARERRALLGSANPRETQPSRAK